MQRHRVFIEIDEDESFPKREIHRAQGIISLIEPRHFIHVRRADQPTIEPVGPGVIRTLNRGRVAACVFLQSRSSVAAHIKEAVHLSIFISNNNQRFPDNLLDEVVARIRDLTLMADQ